MPDEDITVGLRLASALGLARIHYIDDHLDKDEIYAQVIDGLDAAFAPGGPFGQADALFADLTARLQQAAKAGDLLPYYEYLNSREFQVQDVRLEWGQFLRSKLPSRLDRSRLALWEVRNLNMVSHIRRTTVLNPGKRILVIVGASHKAFFDAYLSQMADIRVRQLGQIGPDQSGPDRPGPDRPDLDRPGSAATRPRSARLCCDPAPTRPRPGPDPASTRPRPGIDPAPTRHRPAPNPQAPSSQAMVTPSPPSARSPGRQRATA